MSQIAVDFPLAWVSEATATLTITIHDSDSDHQIRVDFDPSLTALVDQYRCSEAESDNLKAVVFLGVRTTIFKAVAQEIGSELDRLYIIDDQDHYLVVGLRPKVDSRKYPSKTVMVGLDGVDISVELCLQPLDGKIVWVDFTPGMLTIQQQYPDCESLHRAYLRAVREAAQQYVTEILGCSLMVGESISSAVQLFPLEESNERANGE